MTKSTVLPTQTAQQNLSRLDNDWQISDDGKSLIKHYRFKSFAKTMFFVNILAAIADKNNHHPDVSFGWGYCHVTFTTHDAGGLTELDFSCAEQVDDLISKT